MCYVSVCNSTLSCVQYALLISALQKDNYLRLQLLSFKMARTPRLKCGKDPDTSLIRSVELNDRF